MSQEIIDISYKKALKATTVEIDAEFLEKIWQDTLQKIMKSDTLVPPLFDEFTIITRDKNALYNMVEKGFIQKDRNFVNLSQKDQKKFINDVIEDIARPFSYDTTNTFYVHFKSATNFDIVFFEGQKHRKTILCEVEYDYSEKNDRMTYFSTTSSLVKNIEDEIEENANELSDYIVGTVLIVSYYMQHYNPNIDYIAVEADDLKKNESKSNNKGFSQKIRLKSKIKKYILNGKIDEENKEVLKNIAFKKHCWYVRGYYQRFGRNKIIKYIPPRVNYRKDIKENKDKFTPKNNNYSINE